MSKGAAHHLVSQGEYGKAAQLAEKALQDNPRDVAWLCMYVFCLEKVGNISAAYHLCKALSDLAPKDPSVWLNLTNLASRLWNTDEAVSAGKRGLRCATEDKEKLELNVNLGCVHVDTGQFSEALKYFKAAAEIDPEAPKVLSNRGFCELAERQWDIGWKDYRHSLGLQWRQKRQYLNPPEPEWDGTPGKRVCLYGEQGIGDQICFASMVEDCAKDNEVILDVSPKLGSLFRRSFPFASVYGTLGKEYRPWQKKDQEFDASLAMGQIGEYYRTRDEDFPRKPFLVPDEERLLMWRALWATKKKPVIGIALTGGIQKTGAKYRRSRWEDWLPLFEAVDAHYVSLEYKPTRELDTFVEAHGVDLKEYPHATLTEHYDDTAALVASLDCVVSVPTSIWHLAGGLGVPLVALKHRYPCWKTAAGLPFHPVSAWVDWPGTWKQSVINAIPHVREIVNPVQKVSNA